MMSRILLLSSALIAAFPAVAAASAGEAIHVLTAQAAAALPAARAASLAIASRETDATDRATAGDAVRGDDAAAWDARMVRSCVRVGRRVVC